MSEYIRADLLMADLLMSEHGHDQVPADPVNGDRFTCERCGVSCEFVVLDDGLPGEWVDV